MTKLPSEAEPMLVRIVPGPDGVPTVRIKNDRRWGPIIARLIGGILLIIVGFSLAQRLYDQRPPMYMIAHAVDAAKVADLPLDSTELNGMTGYQTIPAYPPPSKGKESDRIAADAALIAVDAAATQDDTALAVGFALAIAIAGLTLFVSAFFAW
jgi:hypothetical protein